MHAETLYVGDPLTLRSRAPTGPFGVVFEDDGETGYLYGIDSRAEDSILDSLCVYNAAQVKDRELPSLLEIRWSGDGSRAVLFLNGYAHAGFDFALRRGYCRTNYPPSSDWSSAGHAWNDDVLAGLEPAA